MKKYYLILLHAVLLNMPGVAFSGDVFSGPVALDDVIEKALANNPAIAAARHEHEAASARPSQAATPPDPEFMFQLTQIPFGTRGLDQGMKEYMIEQKIPFPSKLVYGYKAEKGMALAAESMLEANVLEIVRQAKRAYYDAWRLQEEERINRATLSMYSRNKASAETAYASGKVDAGDPVRASVEMGEVEARLAEAEQEKLNTVSMLGSLVDAAFDANSSFMPPSKAPHVENVEELIKKAEAARPDLVAASRTVESYGAQHSFAKSQYGPDLTFRWGYVDMPEDQNNAWTGRVGLSIPLWSLSKQNYGMRESRAMVKRAESMKQKAVLDMGSEVRSAYSNLSAARRLVDVYSKTVVPRARLLVSSSEEAYRSSKGDFLEVVDSIRSLSDAEIMLVRARADEAAAYADLEKAVGVPLAKEVEK